MEFQKSLTMFSGASSRERTQSCCSVMEPRTYIYHHFIVHIIIMCVCASHIMGGIKSSIHIRLYRRTTDDDDLHYYHTSIHPHIYISHKKGGDTHASSSSLLQSRDRWHGDRGLKLKVSGSGKSFG